MLEIAVLQTMRRLKYFSAFLLSFIMFSSSQARQWTLQECIDYALRNNISLRKTTITKKSATEDLLQSKAALLPSLNATTSHGGTYQPFQESAAGIVSNGYVQSSADKFYYNGTYGVNSSWTVWDGNRNRNQVKLNQMAVEQAELDSAQMANSIQEQIVQLFVQILYSEEAIRVNEASLETSIKNEERGQVFYDVGKMSKADLAQLTSSRAQDEYNLVEAQGNLRNYKRPLKQLLQLTDDEPFDIVVPETTDDMAMRQLPVLQDVYHSALHHRPEIRNAVLGMDMGQVATDIAKAGRLPQVALNANATTNTSSMA